MNKTLLVRQITQQLECELDALRQASEDAHQAATHSESKAENKYDTRGLEAAYLAHGLSVRVQQLQHAIAYYHNWQPRVYTADDPIELGALVTLEGASGSLRHLFLAAQAGGVKAQLDGIEISVVTPTAPLGAVLMRRRLDDAVRLEIKGKQACYEIVGLE